MATVKGKYNYISEILKGTESDDTFMAGSGNEYAFGDYGVDTGLFPYGNNLILSANYYVGFGVAVILVQGKINPIDVYYLDGIEILQTLDGALDLNKIDRLVCKEYGLPYSFIETSPSSAIEGPWNEDLVYSDRFFNTFFPLGDDITIFGKTDAINRIYINYSSENISINQRDFSTTDIYSVLNGELLQHVNGKNLNSIITTDALYSRLPTSLTWEKWGAHEGFNLMKFDLLNNLLFSVTPSATTINEIGTLTTTIETINVASGTTLYYSLSGNGINESDFSSGSLTGSGSVGSNGSFSFSHTIANDLTTEGAETLSIKIFTDSARTLHVGSTAMVSVVDSSTTPAPNNTPTGTPTLSGTLKVGSTLTIDATEIKDSDNFTGYTPTFKYNWETSTDGTAWSKLTTIDGADNNNTYILTAAEANKKIRGVVSYLDGYGTNEVVNSAAIDLEGLMSAEPIKSWTRILGSSSSDSAVSITTGSDGSIYIAGYTYGNLDGNNNAGSADAFLSKYNSDGTKSWTRLLGSSSSDSAVSITTGSDGSIYIAGNTLGNLDGNSNVGNGDAFLSKYNSDGTKSWTRLLGSSSSDSAVSITMGSDGSIYIAGNTLGNLDGNNNAGSADAFLSKYNSDGTKSWTRLLGSSGYESANSITTGSDGSIYIAGDTLGNLDGNSNSGNVDAFLSKYNSDGTKSWTRLLGSSGYESANSITTGSDGSIYIAGYAEGNLDGNNNSGNGDAFLSKYNSDGTKSWTRLRGSSSSDSATSITTGSDGSIYIAGGTFGNLDGNSNAGNGDAFLSKYNSDGNNSWTSLVGTSQRDYAYSVTTGSDGSIYIAGGTEGNLDGNSNVGNGDAFLSKFSFPASKVPTYTLTPSATTINEGAVLTSSVTTTNLATGSKLYYALSGTGITTADFSAGALTGEGSTDATGKFTLTHTIANDLLTEGAESLSIKLYSDSARTLQVGSTATVSVVDYSTTPAPTYTLTPSATTINEGAVLTSSVTTTNLATGSKLYYALSGTGITAADFSAGALTGEGITDAAGKFTFTHTLANDLTTEGTDTLSIKLYSDSSRSTQVGLTASVSIADTSISSKIKEVQSLSSATTPIRYQRNKELTVPINYSTSDGSSTTGLSFKVHFNSSLLSFDSSTGITNKTQADLFQIGATQQDTANSDNDATTDSFIPINIASFTGQFPTAGVPIKLADLIFKSLDKPIDPITGLKDTFINFSESEAASGYGFTASSASLKPISFSLDVDGDSKITALGDGLMIIRKLFGAAFAGDALTNKAMSPTATRTSAEIHEFIQQGITTGLLDVDKDGKTTALGDGLMVIRHLFGAAFAGAALTNKAISPDSPYFGPTVNFAAVAANIDAMRPV